MVKSILFLSIILLMVSCNSSKLDKNEMVFKDTCVVLYQPDSLAIEKLEKEMDTASFADYLEDNQFYYGETIQYLESKNIKFTNTSAKQLTFHKNNDTDFIINIDTLEDRWGMFLFDGINNPKMCAMTDMIPAIDEFFVKK